MRRKRLQHCADILCHKFCGWELANSYRQLVELGSGKLQVDAITGQSMFQGKPISDLTIAGALQTWLRDDLAANNIEIGDLKRAELIADIELTSIDSKARKTQDIHIGGDRRPIEKGAFHRLVIHCSSEVVTDEKIYRSQYIDVEEFPHGWPAV